MVRVEHDAVADGAIVVGVVLVPVGQVPDGVVAHVAGDDVGQVLVHVEEVEDDLGLVAQAVGGGRQEAGEVAERLIPQALLHKLPQMQHAEDGASLIDQRGESVAKAAEPEEGTEAPVPDAPHTGVLPRAGVLAGVAVVEGHGRRRHQSRRETQVALCRGGDWEE